MKSGPKVIKLFSYSTQLSMKFKLLINTKIGKINGNFRFKSPKPVIYPVNIVKMPTIVGKMPTIVGILTFMSRINFILS